MKIYTLKWPLRGAVNADSSEKLNYQECKKVMLPKPLSWTQHGFERLFKYMKNAGLYVDGPRPPKS